MLLLGYKKLFGQPYADFCGKFNKEYTKQIIFRLLAVKEIDQHFNKTVVNKRENFQRKLLY